MQLACPACHTAFYVDPAALGPEGRTVRCARCRNTWFAQAEDLLPEAALAGFANGEDWESLPEVGDAAPLIRAPVQWNDMVMVEVPSSPPLAPGDPAATAVPPMGPLLTGEQDVIATEGRGRTRSRPQRDTRLGIVALALGMIVVVGLIAREPLVRTVPNLADFFAAIGLPVNLRGIEFSGLRTSFEQQDGVHVLVIEGDLVNPTRYTRDLPRLRLAVLGNDERELYTWTALLPRETLLAREGLTFRSRLASPPEEGARVSVRFLHRSDLTDER